MSKREGYLVSECLEWLAVNGFFAWRNNTGAVKIEARYIRYGKIGSGDIIGVLPSGQHFEVECKTENGEQSPEQEIHQMMVEKNNGLYIIVRDVNDLKFLCEG